MVPWNRNHQITHTNMTVEWDGNLPHVKLVTHVLLAKGGDSDRVKSICDYKDQQTKSKGPPSTHKTTPGTWRAPSTCMHGDGFSGKPKLCECVNT